MIVLCKIDTVRIGMIHVFRNDLDNAVDALLGCEAQRNFTMAKERKKTVDLVSRKLNIFRGLLCFLYMLILFYSSKPGS